MQETGPETLHHLLAPPQRKQNMQPNLADLFDVAAAGSPAREAHGGEMMEGDWRSSILSTHTKALNRQVTEAVLISGGGERERGGGRPVRLLNSKQEFGANLMLEVVVMRGGEVLGQRNNKRRRGGQLREEDVTPIRVRRKGAQGGSRGRNRRRRDVHLDQPSPHLARGGGGIRWSWWRGPRRLQ